MGLLFYLLPFKQDQDPNDRLAINIRSPSSVRNPGTGSQVAEIVFKSYKEEHGVELNAYTGSVVLYIVFALSNWFAPSGIVSEMYRISLCADI